MGKVLKAAIFLIVLCVCVALRMNWIETHLTHKLVKDLMDSNAGTGGKPEKHISNVPQVIILSEKERSNVASCESSVVKTLKKERKRFLKNLKMCQTHHQYMKGGKRLLIEVGGNIGEDAEAFQQLYQPTHIILEPNKYYAENLKKKFKGNPRVTVLNFGLHTETKNLSVEERGYHGDGTSIFAKRNGSTEIKVVNSTKFFDDIGVGQIEVDLISIDCEGCEYGVLESMIGSNITQYFKNIQFEWHSWLPIMNATQRYCRIVELLRRTHTPTFQFRYVYESWRRNDLL